LKIACLVDFLIGWSLVILKMSGYGVKEAPIFLSSLVRVGTVILVKVCSPFKPGINSSSERSRRMGWKLSLVPDNTCLSTGILCHTRCMRQRRSNQVAGRSPIFLLSWWRMKRRFNIGELHFLPDVP